MNIGIDLRQIVLGAGGGISQQVKGICEHLFALHPEHHYFVFSTPFNRSLLDYEAAHVRFFSLTIPDYFEEVDRIATEKNIHVLFRTYPMEDNLQFPLCRQIFLIPDIQHEIYPEFFSAEALHTRRIAFARALSNAGAIGTISEFSRKALTDFPDTRCPDVFLMPPALQVVHKRRKGEQELSEAELALIPPTDFFLFPANLWQHKNHFRLLQAFRRYREKSQQNPISLILTGHPDGWPDLARKFPDLPVNHLGFVRPELLRVLLERARALVFFSLYEGFGMPLLEAFDAGTPVICSNTTSLPEVGGDAILTCDPKDVSAIATLMDRIQSDDALRGKLVKCGKTRLGDYSWEKSAHSLIAACERVTMTASHLAISPSAHQDVLPLVSIVTPSFNQGRLIQKTIESVLNQNYPNIEYVVIDGGSSDKTVAILQSYGDRLNWVSETDHGQTHAINKGMARVNGEILAYLNSDDVLVPGAVERVVNFFSQYPDCDMVYGQADYIDKSDRVIGRYKTADYSFNRLVQDCMICQPATFWRRRIAESVGAFDEQLNYVMDYDYWLRIAKAGGNIHFLRKKLACSRIYPETKTLSARNEIYKEIFKISKKHANYIHLNYYQGYWHHLIYEKNNFVSLVLRRFPGSYAKFGWLHQKWDQRDRYSTRQVADFLIKEAKRRLGALGITSQSIKDTGMALSPAVSRGGINDKPVSGFGPDNWLGPKVTVEPKRRVSGHILHIAGVAPVDLMMRISAGGEEVYCFPFKKQQYQKASFPAEAIGNQRLVFDFSAYIEDANNRRLSFLLKDTNIFSESDTV